MDTRNRDCRHSPLRGFQYVVDLAAVEVTPISLLGSKLVCKDPDMLFYRPRPRSQEEFQKEKGNIYLLTENRTPVAYFFCEDILLRPGRLFPMSLSPSMVPAESYRE